MKTGNHSLAAGLLLFTAVAAYAQEGKITVLNPKGIPAIPLPHGRQPANLDANRVLVDSRYDGAAASCAR